MVTVHHQQGGLASANRVILESRIFNSMNKFENLCVKFFRCGSNHFHKIQSAPQEYIDRARDEIVRGHSAAVVPEIICPPKAMFFDMDATVIAEESLVEIAKVCGKQTQIENLTNSAMTGVMDFKDSLSQRLMILKGLTRDQVLSINPSINLGMTELASWAHDMRIPIFLVSGGFVDLAAPVAQKLGFKDFKANRFAWDGDIMTGFCDGPMIDGNGKRDAIKAWCQNIHTSPTDCVVVGDGANDRSMMEISGLAVGFSPKKTLWPMLDIANHTGDHRFLIQCLNSF
jgi:phosphoserine phosphatase